MAWVTKGKRAMTLEEPTPEQLFAEFKSLVQIHLHQILKLDSKPPLYAVALLVAVACEPRVNREVGPGAGDPDKGGVTIILRSNVNPMKLRAATRS